MEQMGDSDIDTGGAPTPRPDLPALSGGRSGSKVKTLTGPPNSAIKGFSTLERPFDQVRYQTVSGSDLRAVGELGCMPLGEAIFKCVVNKGAGEREELSALEVEV